MNTIKLNTIGEAPIKKGGASGGCGDGGIKYTYYDVSSLREDIKSSVAMCASLSKCGAVNEFEIFPALGLLKYPPDALFAIAVDLSAETIVMGQSETVAELLERSRGDYDLVEITKETFYGIKPDSTNTMTIDFQGMNNECLETVNEVTFAYKDGMTWGEWISSGCNDAMFTRFSISASVSGGEMRLGGSNQSSLAWALYDIEKERLVAPDDIIESKIYRMDYWG